MRKLSADYVFPVTQNPIANGIVILDNSNVVVDVINPELTNYSVQDVKTYKGFICPGFVNTHCHLELSYLKNRILENTGLHNFILEIQRLKKESEELIHEAILLADKEMLNNGIKAVGDISNNNLSFSAKKNSKIVYHTFIEVFGSHSAYADKIFSKAIGLVEEYANDKAISIVPHAPYSVSKELFKRVKIHALKNNSILTMHNQENEDENIFFRSNEGLIEKRLKLFGTDNNSFQPTGINSLPSVAKELPTMNPFLMVHNAVTDATDIAFAEDYFKNLYWCFCPNSNLYIENHLPDFQLFLKNENNITIGTDSLASNKTLSVLEELKTIQYNLPFVELNTLIKWGTYNGASFLNLKDTLGSIEINKRPGINLIEKVDLLNIKLSNKSSIKVLA